MSSPGNNKAECEEGGQAAAYVLRALGHEEAERYRKHLSDCAVCSTDVLSLQPVADSLPVAAPPVVVPQALRERVMATVRSEAELLHAAGAEADRPQPARPRWRLRRMQLFTAAAAMGVGVLLGAVAINTGSRGPAPRVTTTQAQLVTPAKLASVPPGAKAFLRQSGGHAELVISGVSQPPRGKIYELWLAREGKAPQPTNALFGVTRKGDASVNVPGDLTGVKRVMVTAEPRGGSSQPTSSPIIVATLRTG